MSTKKTLLILIKVGILAGLIALAITTQDLHQIWTLISKVDLRYLGAFLLLNVASVAMASSNLFILLRPLGRKTPWRRLFYFDLLSLAGSYYTPGGVGGVATIAYMISKEAGLKDAAVVVFMDKAITLLVASLLMGVYGVFFAQVPIGIAWGVFGLVLAAMAGLMAAMYLSGWLRERALKTLERARCYWGSMPVLGANLVITLGIFLLSSMQYMAAFRAIGLPVEDPILIFISCGILLIINYLPIAFGGIGLGEVSAVFLWGGMGLTSEQVLSAMLTVRVFAFLATLLLGGGALLVRQYKK